MAFRSLNGGVEAFGGSSFEVRGEHRLLANVLHRALEDALGKYSRPDLRDAALGWIFSEPRVASDLETKGFDFDSVCEYLKLNPDWVRRSIIFGDLRLSSHNYIREVRSRKRGPSKASRA